jgi:hypothetical protein
MTFVASLALTLGGSVGLSSAAHASSLVLTYEADDAAGAKVLNTCNGPTWECAFEGAAVAIAAAPAGGGSGQALQITKNGQAWAGLNLLQADSGSELANASSATVTMEYFSPDSANSPVEFQLIPTSGATISAAAEAVPGWQTLTFDMTTAPGYSSSANYTKAVLFPDFVNSGDVPSYTGAPAVAVSGQNYFVDNVTFQGADTISVPAGPAVATSTLLTFESGDALGATATSGGFSGATAAIGAAPAGGNGGNALLITKAGDAWSGVNIATAPTGVKFLDATHKTITLNYFSPDSANSPVQINITATDNSAIKQAVQAVPGWQVLTFDFSGSYDDSKTYNLITLFPDFVNSGDVPSYTGAAAVAETSQVYAVDNMGINGASTPAIPVALTAPSTLLTYEANDTAGAKVLNACGGATWECAFEGAVVAVKDAAAGGNGGKALQITKSGNPWAGLNLLQAASGTKLADSTHHTITMNYFSADSAHSPVELQLIAGGTTISKAVEAAPGWQTLTFDMSTAAGYSASADYTKAVLFPDWASDDHTYTGAATVPVANQNYFVDNIAFNGATTPAIVPVVKPVVRVAATVAGTAKVGKSLTAGKGTWTGTGITYSYKWYRCTVIAKATGSAAPAAAAKCSVIAGATTASHKVVTADVGKYLRVQVTATNSAGSTLSLSKSTTAKASK